MHKVMPRILVALIALVMCAQGVVADDAPPPTEDEHIAVLQSEADWEAKFTACRALRQIGTEKSVPALASLLGDEQLSHMACYALEPMENEAAGAALIAALPSLNGAAQAGVAASLGARGEVAAVDALTALVTAADPAVAHAAAGALGRIANEEAIAALKDARGGENALAVDEALLAGAQRLIAKGEEQDAMDICMIFVDDAAAPEQIRLGAMRLWAFAAPGNEAELALDLLDSDEGAAREMAGQIVAETSDAGATRTLVKALPDLSASSQAILLRGLGDRGDVSARRAVTKLIDSDDPTVRQAAIGALGKLGDEDTVETLAGFLADPASPESAIASAALRAMPGIDDALADAIEGADTDVQAGILTVMTNRLALEAVPLATASVDAEDAALREAALNTLLQLAGPDEVPVVLVALASATASDERALVGRVLTTVSGHHGDAVLPLILDAQNGADAESQRVLSQALGSIGTPAALEAVVANLENEATRDEALKILADWRTADAAPHLLELAKSDDEAVQDTAFEGYVRLARSLSDVPKKEEMLVTAMDLAQRKQQRWKVFSAWSTVATGKSMSTLLPYLDDSEVEREAASAVIEVAKQIATHSPEAKAWAVECLQAVIEKTSSEGVRGRAQAELDKIS